MLFLCYNALTCFKYGFLFLFHFLLDMVVSGLPVRNGDQHAAEIANMSLQLLSSLNGIGYRHLVGSQVQLRIGMHSGISQHIDENLSGFYDDGDGGDDDDHHDHDHHDHHHDHHNHHHDGHLDHDDHYHGDHDEKI